MIMQKLEKLTSVFDEKKIFFIKVPQVARLQPAVCRDDFICGFYNNVLV